MKLPDRPYGIDITDVTALRGIADDLTLGRHHVFISDPRLLDGTEAEAEAEAEAEVGAGTERQALGDGGTGRGRVLPTHTAITLPGVTLTPEPAALAPLVSVVSDRMLYRAERDTVYLCVAAPLPVPGLRLRLACNGRAVKRWSIAPDKFSDGMLIRALPTPQPGRY